MKSNKLLAVLQRPPLGYRVARQSGSHMHLVSDDYPPLVFAPHAGRSVAPGLVRNILCKQVGLTEDEALRLL